MITEDAQDDEDEDDPVAGGLEESQGVFQPDAVRAMTDDELLNAFRVLSNPRATLPSNWLGEIEQEVRARGLLREH